MVANICFLNGIEGPENISLRLSNTPDNFLITLGNRRVVEYRMSDKTVINSYFLPSHMSYSTPMASTKFSSDSIKKELICVVNKKHLYCWDGQENRLDEVKEKMELPHAAIDLIEDNGKILLVFENGDIQSVDHIIQQMSNSSGIGKFTELTKGRYTRTANSNVGKVYICRLVCWEACLDALL